MRAVFLTLIAAILFSCTQKQAEDSPESFEKDLISLKEYFHIPGLAIHVTQNNKTVYENYLGYADLQDSVPVNSTTVFPIASITKTFSSTLIMQFVESGDIDLNDPINNYLENSSLSDSIQVKHILSHTSEGTPGSFFNYSPRFFLLTNVLEKVSGMPLDKLMQEKILAPLSLKNTFPVTSQSVIDSLSYQFAKPYYYYGQVEYGHFDIGLSTASGLSSTVSDISRFSKALQSGKLISSESFEALSTPFTTSYGKSPYGYGIFSQEFLGKKLVWGYGQEDCYSSLMLMVPEDNITLTLLANNNLMSDPPRLINGDITYSLFALSFLRHYVFDLTHNFEINDWKNTEEFDFNSNKFSAFYRQQILAQALSASFMGWGDPKEFERSAQLTRVAFENFPDYTTYGNLSLMKLLSVLINTNPDEFGDPIENLGSSLLEEYEYNPYANIYLAEYYRSTEQYDKAFNHFQKIAEAPNYRPFWYTIEALDFLGEHYKEEDPELAKTYFQKIIDIGWNMGGKLDKAKEEIKNL